MTRFWISSFLILAFIGGLLAQTGSHIHLNDAIRVRLLVYSGRSDPVWNVPRSSPFYRNISILLRMNNSRPPNPFPRLGYNGFDVMLPGSRRKPFRPDRFRS
uniref:Uncharacterized protein LOC111127065 n=1 Tax=Crassostrea virginica TaxID=6565 RepID=A0A8B8DI19_CRAVI|nr:uncharacterized protein LOC111127065 [Crassostrea virginica]